MKVFTYKAQVFIIPIPLHKLQLIQSINIGCIDKWAGNAVLAFWMSGETLIFIVTTSQALVYTTFSLNMLSLLFILYGEIL